MISPDIVRLIYQPLCKHPQRYKSKLRYIYRLHYKEESIPKRINNVHYVLVSLLFIYCDLKVLIFAMAPCCGRGNETAKLSDEILEGYRLP